MANLDSPRRCLHSTTPPHSNRNLYTLRCNSSQELSFNAQCAACGLLETNYWRNTWTRTSISTSRSNAVRVEAQPAARPPLSKMQLATLQPLTQHKEPRVVFKVIQTRLYLARWPLRDSHTCHLKRLLWPGRPLKNAAVQQIILMKRDKKETKISYSTMEPWPKPLKTTISAKYVKSDSL